MKKKNTIKKFLRTSTTPCSYLYYYLRGIPNLDSSFYLFKNALTPLCLSRDKTKEQFNKNTTLTPTKILFKK